MTGSFAGRRRVLVTFAVSWTFRPARDLPLAEQQKPEIKGLPFRSLAPFQVKGGPNVFLTKRLPDKE